MSDLQIGLLAVGVLVVGGVLAYNALQERKARRDAERTFGSSHADVLMEGGDARQEPRLESPARRSAATDGAELPDARLDYIIELSLGRPAPAAQIAARWGKFEHRFAGLARLAGTADRTGWQALQAGGSCAAVRVALQLASRAGPVSEAQLIEFRAAVDSLASEIGGSVAAPEIRQAVDAARALDALCADADIQVVLHVVPMPGSEFGEDAFAPHPEAAFTVSRGERGSYMLALEVPRVHDVRRAYEAMVLQARDLCARLGGTIVDDNARALDERALALIGAQLDEVCRQLESRGIEPGGAAALRLFA